ncbi:MAG: rexo2 [Parcubacteria group bacterium]|nr:rexo2 [Parcubacteria group bacterium]
MQRNDLLVWVDLEMTSIEDVLVDQITEIAVVLTDKDLNVVAEGPDIIIHADRDLIEARRWAPEGQFPESDQLKELSALSTVSTREAEEEVLAFIQKHVAPNSSPLCGNSIHADRHFLKIHMPQFEKHLFYRCIDVSTLKELARRWAPEVYIEAERRKEHKSHRAKADIIQSIEELQFYREHFFNSQDLLGEQSKG